MSVRARRPSADDLAALLDRCASDDLTYGPTGGSLGGAVAPRLHRREWTTALPDGAFDAGVAALRDWKVHRGAGLDVLADDAINVGTNVAMSAPLPIGYVDVTCRIVAVVDEPDRFGFAYGTLSVHPEQGEESFVVRRDGAVVRFDVVGVSRPVHPLARLAVPVADRLQAAAVRRYLRAMERSVETHP